MIQVCVPIIEITLFWLIVAIVVTNSNAIISVFHVYRHVFYWSQSCSLIKVNMQSLHKSLPVDVLYKSSSL